MKKKGASVATMRKVAFTLAALAELTEKEREKKEKEK